MDSPNAGNLTELRMAWSDGDEFALEALAEFDERKARIVELRFFGGLTVEETAEILKVAPITVMREWQRAKVWLYRELSNEN